MPIYVFLQVGVPIQVTMDICLDSGHPVPNVEQVELVGQDTEPSAASFDMVNDTAKKWIIGLAMSTLILAATLVIGLVHLTKQYLHILVVKCYLAEVENLHSLEE